MGKLIAAIDATSNSVSFFARGPNGKFARIGGLSTGSLPVRIASADLDGDGLGDLVVLDAGDGILALFKGNQGGGFTAGGQISVGTGISDLALLDLGKNGKPDIVVTDKLSGDVQVFFNDGNLIAASDLHFRAGAGPFGIADINGTPLISSQEGTNAVAMGDFNSDGAFDLVSVNTDSNTFSLLVGQAIGGYLNPRVFPTGSSPRLVRVADFNRDGHPDLAILDKQNLEIFSGDGAGGFTRTVVIDAGDAPSGLTVADVNGDGIPDLVVGNELGDVLIFLGKGDGMFKPFQRAGQFVALAVADLNGDGKDDFVFANQASDSVSVEYGGTSQAEPFHGRKDGLLAPGAVAIQDLNGDGIPDLIVANSGSNNILVYLGTGKGQFGPAHSFFAGTNPRGITIQDLNGDGIPDLVAANEGSNDVSVLFGQGQGANWTLRPGPRLKAGTGPVATVAGDYLGHGFPDLLVTNSQSDDVYLIPAVGQGFFDDRNPTIFATGINPQQTSAGNFDGAPGLDLVTINAGSNDLTFISDFATSPVFKDISSGGDEPMAALPGDFNGDGLSDLIVADNGDGRIILFLGGPDGLTLADNEPGPDHPTDLALAALRPSAVDLYVSQEGEDTVSPLTLVLSGQTSSGSSSSGGSSSGNSSSGNSSSGSGSSSSGQTQMPGRMSSVSFVSLPESNLGLIVIVGVSLREEEEASSVLGGQAAASEGALARLGVGGGDEAVSDLTDQHESAAMDFISGLGGAFPIERLPALDSPLGESGENARPPDLHPMWDVLPPPIEVVPGDNSVSSAARPHSFSRLSLPTEGESLLENERPTIFLCTVERYRKSAVVSEAHEPLLGEGPQVSEVAWVGPIITVLFTVGSPHASSPRPRLRRLPISKP
jgi:hypothetical protein